MLHISHCNTVKEVKKSYQNYTIREVDGKLALFDETGENVRCPTAIRPNSKFFFTTWGVFEFSKSRSNKKFPQSFSALVFSGEKLWRDAESAMQFTKNGHVGWKTPSGDLIMPPIYDQIEICESFIWANYANREIFIYKNGCLSEREKSDNKFYENGKIGLKNPDGTILFPAIYDEILLNYLVRKEGWSVLSTVLRICQRLYSYVSKCNVESADETNRAYKKIKWALNHYPSLKLVAKGKSSLDLIRESIQVLEKSEKKGQKGKLQILKKIERLLLKNGAHTATEIRNESFDPYNLW